MRLSGLRRYTLGPSGELPVHRFVGSGAWVISGGADATARASLPLSRGPQLRARLDWSATPLDLIRVAVEAFDYRYSNGNRASIVSLTSGWSTRPWRGAELSVAVGPGFGRAQIRDEPATLRAYAVGTAEFRSAVARDLSAAIGASVEPLGDPVSGDLVERGSLRLSAAWGGPRGISVGARLIGSVALTSATGGTTSPQAGDRFLQGELSATMRLSVRSSVAVGVRGAYLSRPVLDQPADQWVAFVSYAAQVPLQR